MESPDRCQSAMYLISDPAMVWFEVILTEPLYKHVGVVGFALLGTRDGDPPKQSPAESMSSQVLVVLFLSHTLLNPYNT